MTTATIDGLQQRLRMMESIIHVQGNALDRISNGNERPGHVAYLSKEAMANAARCALQQVQEILDETIFREV